MTITYTDALTEKILAHIEKLDADITWAPVTHATSFHYVPPATRLPLPTTDEKLTRTALSPRMNPDVKAVWLEALRSGRYNQTRGALRLGGGYCCLGVLTHVLESSLDPDLNLWTLPSFPGDTATEVLGLGMPAEAVQIAAGLKGPVLGQLASLNDGGGNFTQIADWIEANL